MIRSYVHMAMRRLKKNRLYSIINIFGLAIGMTCFMLLMLYVNREFSFDEHISDSDQIYEVFLGDDPFGKFHYSYGTIASFAEIIKESIPEVEAAVRFGKWENRVLKVDGGRFLYDQLYYTDKSFLETFELKFINNQTSSIRFEAKDIILSLSEAIKLFGDANKALGQIVEVVDLGDFQVTGVFEEIPENSHVDVSVLIPFGNVRAIHDQSNQTVGGRKMTYDLNKLNAFPLYLKLDEAFTDFKALETKLASLMETNYEIINEVKLLPLQDIYFSDENPAFFGKSGDESGLNLYVLIGIIILTLAIVNYANLATAQYGQRSMEVGVRKSMGGFRSQLILQFISESLALSGISVVLSLCLLEVVTPWFRDFSGADIAINYADPFTYLFLVGFALVVGAISGLYPAIYLSRLGILETLKGRLSREKSGTFVRQFLAGFQFFVCLSLITITGVVLKQFDLMTTIDRGFDTQRVITFSIEDRGVKQNYGTFKSDLLQNPNVTFVNGSVFSNFNEESPVLVVKSEKGEGKVLVSMMITEPDFVQNMGIEVLEGNSFNVEEPKSNQGKVLVNQAVVDEFGWTDPLNEKLMDMPVIGVLDNFLYGSVKNEVRPLMIMMEETSFSRVYLQLNENDIQSSLENIEAIYDKYSAAYPFEFAFLDDQFSAKYHSEVRLKKVFTSFSVLAIFIAGLGMLGLSLFLAEQRMKEIGVRKVLGASVFDIVLLLNTNITKLIAISSLIALPFTYYFMSDWLDSFANRISLSALSFIVPMLALLVFSWLILSYQSLSAARRNPVNALRAE